MKRELEVEAHHADNKKGRLENGQDNPHMVNGMQQQQFLHQQHQYLQHQLQQLQQQQQQLQHQPPQDQPQWNIQGQCVPRPALPPHMIPYAPHMQSFIQGPYSQPAPLPRHHTPYLPYQPYHNDPNAHQIVPNPYVLQQQTTDVQKFTNIPDHTPSPSPSPNRSLSPEGESQTSDVNQAVHYEHSKEVIDYSKSGYSSAGPQPVTPVEYPSPAQSPILPGEHINAAAVMNNPYAGPNPYAGLPPTGVIDASVKFDPAGVLGSLKESPQSRTPYVEVPSSAGISSAAGVYTSGDLSNSTTSTEVPAIAVTKATTPSKESSAFVYSHHTPVHSLISSPSTPHSQVGFPIPSSPYTSSLPNPPPNSPAVAHVFHESGSQSINNDKDIALHSRFTSANISQVHQYYSGVETSVPDNNMISNTAPVIEKFLVEHDSISENLPCENREKIQFVTTLPHIADGLHHGSIMAASPVVHLNIDKGNCSYSSNGNGNIGAFAAMIKSEPDHNEYNKNMEREKYSKYEYELNLGKTQQNQEVNTDLRGMGLKIGSDQMNCEINTEDDRHKEMSAQKNSNENDSEKKITEDKKEDKSEELVKKKPFSFSPYLYEYLNSKQKEIENEKADWSSQLCTPPESPPATNASTPTNSPTAPVPLITLTPCTTFVCPADRNCTQDFSNSAISEMRDDMGILCQGGDILMRNADGSFRIVGSPVKFDDAAIMGASVSPNHQLEFHSPTSRYLPYSAASSPGSDVLGDILTQVGLVGVMAEEDMCLDENVIGFMEGKGPSPSLIGEAHELGYYQQRQFACHLCHEVYHDAWNLQVHMVSHPTPTPRPKRRSLCSQSSTASIDTSPQPQGNIPLYLQGNMDFIPPHLTPSMPKGTKFRRGGRAPRTEEKENQSPARRSLSGKFLCPECNLDYPSQGHMRRHLESHGANRRFPCDMCTASYSRSDTLKKHREQHFLQNQC